MAIPPKRPSLPQKEEAHSSSDGITKLKVVDEVVQLRVVDEKEEEPSKEKPRKKKKKEKKKEKRSDKAKVVLEDDSAEEKKRFYPSDEKQLQLNEAAHAVATDAGKNPANYVERSLEAQWDEKETSARKIPIGWVILTVLLVTAACGFSLYKLVMGEQAASQKQIAVAQEIEEEQRVDDVDSALLYENINETIEAFFSAETVDDLLKVCRHPERVRPLVTRYYDERPMEQQIVETITGMAPVALGENPLERKAFVVVTVKTDKLTQHVLFEQISDNRVLVDWESLVSYQPMDWEKYIKTRPSQPMNFRVRAKLDHFYTYEFSDEDVYQSVFLQVKDSPEYLFGYMDRNDPAFKKLMKVLSSTTPQAMTPLILQLRFPEAGDSKNAVIIDEVLQDGWTYDSNPDERLQDH